MKHDELWMKTSDSHAVIKYPMLTVNRQFRAMLTNFKNVSSSKTNLQEGTKKTPNTDYTITLWCCVTSINKLSGWHIMKL